jgi:hypothetical protein
MSGGDPDSFASLTRALVLTTSTSLWVRSSSDLTPLSSVIDGLVATGGTGSTWRTNHSGLADSGSYPRRR